MIPDVNLAHNIASPDNMNSTTSTLAEPGRSTPSGFLDPEKDRSNVDMSDRSTRAPSTDIEFEKANNGDVTDTETVRDEDVAPQQPPEEEYPTGFRLGMIVFALCAAVFLVALDMVSTRDQDVLCRARG